MLDIEFKSQWNTPVSVGFDPSGVQMVKGPFDALELMAEKWPQMRGMQFVRARSLCRAALDGRKTMEEARLQFEQAVREAQSQIN